MNCFIMAFKSQILLNIARTIIEITKNKKYLDIPLFYNNEDDKKKWEK